MTAHRDQHLGIYPKCGIYTDTVFRHERVTALYGNDDSTSYRGQTRPFPFPQHGHNITRVDGFLLCRYPDCKKCAASPEFIPVHYECFEIFRKRCSIEGSGALYRLWTIIAWKNPWRRAPPVYLENDRLLDLESFKTIAQMCGLSQLCEFPPELLWIVQGYSQHASLWRATSALRLATFVSVTDSEPLITMPLDDVSSWKRGEKPECVSSRLGVIRLTIDCDGIKRVERLSCCPAYAGESNNRFAFIVEEGKSHSGLVARFKYGLLRLKLPPDRQCLPIWNTPAPPNLSLCREYPAEIPSWQRFFAVEVNNIAGITFFFSSGQLFGIHVHHSKESCAISTYQRFSNRRRRGVVWVYLPITKSDPLLMLGTRKSSQLGFSILVRTQKVGDIVLGPQNSDSVTDRYLGHCAPITLIYAEPREERPVPFIGAYCKLPSVSPKRVQLPEAVQRPLGENAYFSWALLKGVSSAQVFYDENRKYCKGIIFHYRNGGCRAVGQCRLHVDPTERVFQPQGLCFRIVAGSSRHNRATYTVKINFGDKISDRHGVEGWCYRPLGGVLNFWFTHDSSFIAIEN
ncbi:hypothetical protein F5X99DRAFT_380534 [Biscogniauxia marginata]|nr:hypothetical protein F5X99DRAFT_380534 [Biscogniauxia marginata]